MTREYSYVAVERHGWSENLRTVAKESNLEGGVVDSCTREASDHFVQKSVSNRSSDAHFHARERRNKLGQIPHRISEVVDTIELHKTHI